VEKHKQIGKDIFISLLPWTSEKFVVQATFGDKRNYIRGRSVPYKFKTAMSIYKNMRKKTEVGMFLMKNRKRSEKP
jgi:hypothetical protein